MKKTYITPSQQSITIATAKFLCGSLRGDGLNMQIYNSGANDDADGRDDFFEEED